jgi:hypothetical protein
MFRLKTKRKKTGGRSHLIVVINYLMFKDKITKIYYFRSNMTGVLFKERCSYIWNFISYIHFIFQLVSDHTFINRIYRAKGKAHASSERFIPADQ